MLQLIETICYDNGVLQRIDLHEERLNYSRKSLFGSTDWVSLESHLSIPAELSEKKVKCRISYSSQITAIEYHSYTPKRICNLKLVFDDQISYQYKFKDRYSIERLLERKGNFDEILIVKENLITDTSFSNIIFLKDGIWYTPNRPLLDGTRRKDYINRNLIVPIQISVNDIYQFEEAKMINAMLSLEDSEPIDIQSIK